jgi:DNA repair exonuclease SbcCD ATPase subunit
VRFLRIELQNFLSFGPACEVALDQQGLLAVFGQNKDSATADSNGSGKSTLMEAIVWCLYGETMRGYKGDEVVNRRIGKDCYVTLELADEGNQYLVTRHRKQSGVKKQNDVYLEVNGNPITAGINADTQALITTLVGMDFSTFTQSVMLYHRGKSFSEMKDSEQKAVLEEILQIDELSQARAVVRKRVIAAQQRMVGVTAKLQTIANRQEQGRVQLHKLTQSANQHRTLVLQRRRELQQQKAAAEVRMEDVYRTTGLDVTLERQAALHTLVEQLEGDRADIQRKELEITKKYGDKRAEISNEVGQIQGSWNRITPAVQAMSSLAGKTCPTCHRDVDPDEAEATIEALESHGEKLRGRLNALDKKRQRFENQEKSALKKAQEGSAEVTRKLGTARAELQTVTEAIHKRRTELRLICQLEQQVFHLRDEIDELDASENPYHNLVADAEKEMSDLAKQVKILRYEERALDIELRHLNYWDIGFSNSGLKSYVIENVIPFLNQRAQHYANILTDGDLRIEFSTTKELKKGGVKEEFQVNVINKAGADVYKGNSDGERRRIDLAVGWALGDLAAQRAKKPIRFKGLDEPFENLDETGEDRVIKLLHSVLSDYETIVCVTHSTHLRNQFPAEIMVRKENGISAVV